MSFPALAAIMILPLFIGCGEKIDAREQVSETKSEWTTEEHWMVAGIIEDLAGMTRLAGGEDAGFDIAAGEREHSFSVGVTELTMKPSCWDIDTYLELIGGWKPVAKAAPAPALDVVEILLTPTAKELQRANLEVSARLSKFPGSHVAHEEAAFVLGVLGMRENAGNFSDIRPLIGRVTAHLAMANVLRGASAESLAGKWAGVFHDLLMGRPKVAREAMASIPAEGNSGRWKRAVEMLITGDWRRGGDLDAPSLIEVIAHARALQIHRGNSEAIELIKASEALQATPEWTRLLMRRGASVEEGHIAMGSGAGMEFAEISEIFDIGKDPDERSIGRHLIASAPSRLVSKKGVAKVISDADWAAYFRRHLYACFDSVSYFTIRRWANGDAAAEWEKSVDAYCRNMPDYALVRPFFQTRDPEYQAAVKDAAEYVKTNPQNVPVALWTAYRYPNICTTPGTTMPAQMQWFRDVSPPESAHDPERRAFFEGIYGYGWVPALKILHEIDPWNYFVCYELAKNTGNDMASVSKAWGNVREYSVRPLKQILEGKKLSMADRIETLETYAAIVPEKGIALGEALVLNGKPEEAIKAYDMAFEKSSDRVLLSNSTSWMIHYYKSKGEDARARKIADHNAEVYSARGLLSAMALALDEKDFPRALDYAEKMFERYDDTDGLVAVGLASGKPNPAFKTVFPNGVKKVSASDFSEGERVVGARVTNLSLTVTTSGMKMGDVILAADGIRIEDGVQYIAVMDTTLNPTTHFIFKRGKKVMEIECVLPGRRLDTHLEVANR